MAHSKNKYPTPAVSLTQHPASLPKADILDAIDHASIAHSYLQELPDLAVGQLTDNAIWRDSLALTGTLRTFFRPKLIAQVWKTLSAENQPCEFNLTPGCSRVVRAGPEVSWIEARFTFILKGSRPARCSGVIGLVPDDSMCDGHGVWRLWLLCTVLEQPVGYPDVDHLVPGAPTFNTAAICDDDPYKTPSVDCLVVGAGIGGLCMAGRLKALGLSYVVVEEHAEVGDTWIEHRYESVKLHTSKEYNQMPGVPRAFGPDEPYHLTGKDLACGFQKYVKTFDINILTSTTLKTAKWSEKESYWTTELKTHGNKFVMKARHIVLATGNNGIKPKTPTYLHQDQYKGDVIHGVHWKNATRWAGKRGIVVGSGNTAHDIIADMVKADFHSVTMIQRGKTFVLPVSTFSAVVDPLFNDHTATELADRMMWAYPLPIQRLLAMAAIRAEADKQGEYFDRLEAAGLRVERHGDLWGQLYDTEGGHFFDLGSGELIADGRVTVKSDALPVSYTESGLEFSDGCHIDADLIVFATGYEGNIRHSVASIFGDGIAGGLQEFWQCDEEGEIRGAWRHTGHPRIWYTGHGFAHARWYSRFIALHIKAEVEGEPIEMYTETPDIKT